LPHRTFFEMASGDVRIVIDRAEQVKADAEAIRQLSARVPVLVFVNNHFAGYAPETIEQLRRALGLTC